MGRVFPPEVISAGDYPVLGAHESAASALMTEFQAENKANGFTGMVYGSTTFSYASIRSDLDVLGVIPDSTDTSTIQSRVVDYIAEVATEWRVPVEANVISAPDLAQRRRRFVRDSLFMEHLASVARSGKYVVGDVETYLQPHVTYDSAQQQWLAARLVTQHYTSWKGIYFLEGSVAVLGQPNYHKLQRAFELPSALGRKLLRLVELTEWTSEHGEQNTSYPEQEFYARQSLAERVRGIVADTPYTTSVDWLANHDNEYTQLLQSTLQGETTITDYATWLKDVYQPAMRHALRLSVGAFALARRQDATKKSEVKRQF